MLATLIKPDSGDALYNEVSAVKSPTEIRSKLAFLTTDLKPDMKSTPSIMFDFFAELYHVPKDEAQKRKKTLFEEFGIDKFADTMISKLSLSTLRRITVSYS